MKITLDLNKITNKDDVNGFMLELAAKLMDAVEANKKSQAIASNIQQQEKPSPVSTPSQRVGRQASEEALKIRKAVAMMAKGKWKAEEGFTANELAEILSINRLQAMNALIYWSKGEDKLVERVGFAPSNTRGKDPVLWKWVLVKPEQKNVLYLPHSKD